MTVTVTCPGCGRDNRLERRLTGPERVAIVCPGCETLLLAEVTADMFVRQRPRSPFAGWIR